MADSSFREAVLAVVRKIPKGETLSYGQVAVKAGFPGAARAVGSLMKQNHDKTVPCHRVIQSSGRVGQYNGGGEGEKRRRLLAEGVTFHSRKPSMSTLKVGDKAPEFRLPDQDGQEHALKDYKGQWVLLYFYPKDDTPGCTKEACTIRDQFPAFKKLKIKVFGASVDTVKKHASFVKKYDLPFTLLADEQKTLVDAYGVWAKKKFMGREYMGILRNSFLINPEGKIAKIYEGVKPELHADEVLADVKAQS